MIGLYNLEPKYTNIALEKIRMYYKQQGEIVMNFLPMENGLYDKVYCSSIFTWTPKNYVTDDMICGGSGFDLYTKLPAEIEHMKPKINVGFTTRGCIRKCSFCIVPAKEGNIRIVGDIYDFWDGHSKKIIILDNNILALSQHFFHIAYQIRKENLMVDFNQGLDFRLITSEILNCLKKLRYKEYRFSFDNPNDEIKVSKVINLLKKYEIKWSMWYVLVGFNTSYEEDLYRLNLLKNNNQKAYVQRYNKIQGDFYIKLSAWVNKPKWFAGMTFNQFLEMKNTSYERITA